jgi:hypothetical protein
MPPSPKYPTVDELADELLRRDLLPLAPSEVVVFCELFRRATGGVALQTPPPLPAGKLPAAWLTEVAAAAVPHMRQLEKDAPLLRGARGGVGLVYDPAMLRR